MISIDYAKASQALMLEKKRSRLQEQHKLLDEKIRILRHDYVLEYDTERRFKLEKKIEKNEENLSKLEEEIELIDIELSKYNGHQRVTVILEGDFEEINQEDVLIAFENVLGVKRPLIKILQVRPGSIVVEIKITVDKIEELKVLDSSNSLPNLLSSYLPNNNLNHLEIQIPDLLVIDHNDAWREIVLETFDTMYGCDIAYNYNMAVSKINSGHYKLVCLADYFVDDELNPVNYTFEILELLKDVDPKIPVILLYSGPEDEKNKRIFKERYKNIRSIISKISGDFIQELLDTVEHILSKDAKILLEKKASEKLRDHVFISYSHKDKEWLERIQTHFKALENEGINVNIWDDTKIKPGMEWKKEIEMALSSAKVALLLVTADFLASDFIAKNELPPLLSAAQNDGATILSLIIKPSRYGRIEKLSKYQSVNDPKKPLAGLSEFEQDNIFVELMNTIEDCFDVKS